VIRSLWNNAIHLGVTDDLPSSDAQYVMTANGLSVLVSGLILLYLPLLAIYGSGWMILVDLLAVVASVVTLLLNHRRFHYAATLWFTLTSQWYMAAFCVLGGPAFHIHYYFFVHAVGTMLMYPPRQQVTMFLVSGMALATFVAFVAFPGLAPGGHFQAPQGVYDALLVLNVAGTFCCLGAFAYYARRRAVVAEQELEHERAKSEDLLLNVLPAPIAQRLKGGELTIVDAHPEATVLFADIAGFTALSENVDPSLIAEWLNTIFTRFDALADQYGLEKIKTIGDAYMAVSGLPEHKDDHLEAAAQMALAMVDEAAKMQRLDGEPLEIRIGLDMGPVTAGVIGSKKFIYDLWGDTVNTASRMESLGRVGSVQVTGRIQERLTHSFDLERRGEIDVKGKGQLTTWWLLRGK
jgi:adenylate cyclase